MYGVPLLGHQKIEKTVEDEDDLKPEAVTEETEEGRKVVKVKSPMVVTKEIREDHEKTHTPYRS